VILLNVAAIQGLQQYASDASKEGLRTQTNGTGATPSRNVKIKAVLAEPLAVEYPSAGELDGY